MYLILLNKSLLIPLYTIQTLKAQLSLCVNIIFPSQNIYEAKPKEVDSLLES